MSTLPSQRRRRRRSAAARASWHLSERTVEELTGMCRLLADEWRLRILLTLEEHGEMHVSRLCQLLGQAQPAVSHHLTRLRLAGLVVFRRQGKHNYYRSDWRPIRGLLDQLFVDLGNGSRRLRLGRLVLSYQRS
ncbi:MAG: metalloregulator ArsR/SmtB family transcription factor [Gemmataceae bacterium]|nr:metalloregulator ArsR/SmtB family transcription factor [Gemmataceae bacterium]MDW8267495.1 metalloregulator ArsR/SmtB family transcription factor [Gemmataceae bacterium]